MRVSSGQVALREVLGDYACDFRRPDWAHRWSEWNFGQNPYLNLFLCAKHAANSSDVNDHLDQKGPTLTMPGCQLRPLGT